MPPHFLQKNNIDADLIDFIAEATCEEAFFEKKYPP